ncbi:hypothetical protein B7463_g1111, partial [Scytalidium lignicola]
MPYPSAERAAPAVAAANGSTGGPRPTNPLPVAFFFEGWRRSQNAAHQNFVVYQHTNTVQVTGLLAIFNEALTASLEWPGQKGLLIFDTSAALEGFWNLHAGLPLNPASNPLSKLWIPVIPPSERPSLKRARYYGAKPGSQPVSRLKPGPLVNNPHGHQQLKAVKGCPGGSSIDAWHLLVYLVPSDRTVPATASLSIP